MYTHSFLRFLALFTLLAPAAASPPGWWSPDWWSDGVPPVINGSPANNQGPANIGQAKWMVSEALRALDAAAPAIATQVRADLAGTPPDHADRIIDLGIPEPKDAAWIEKQKAPLLIGQLKAIAAPFYTRLNASTHLAHHERTASAPTILPLFSPGRRNYRRPKQSRRQHRPAQGGLLPALHP